MLEISWRPLCSNTILFEILLTKECGMLRIFLKHFAWKALSFLSSALLSHAVCKQYNNFESTQVSKIRIFSALGRTAWFQTRHNVSNSAVAAPKHGSISHENMAETCASEHWKFACHIMNLPHERWARRMLHWQPSGRGPLGRPAMNWTTKFEQFSRLKHWRDWKEVATDADRWMMEADNFIKFCTQ